MRKKLSDYVDEFAGTSPDNKTYQQIKNQYGSLKALEDDVARRAAIHSRANAKGLMDMPDIFSGSQAINAVATQNSALFIAAGTAKGIQSFYKRLNNPDTHIEKVFRNVEKLMIRRQGFIPRSSIGKSIAGIKKERENLRNLNQRPTREGRYGMEDIMEDEFIRRPSN